MRAFAILGMILLLLSSAAPSAFAQGAAETVRPMDLKSMERMITAESYSGLVVFMASWCLPCREELPALVQVFLKYRSQGIQIAGIGLDQDNPVELQKMIDRFKTPFPVFWVGRGAIDRYKIVGVPTTWVIQKGRIIQKLPGRHSQKELEHKIQGLLTPS